MAFFSLGLGLSCFCFARFAYFGSGSGSVFSTGFGCFADFACSGLSHTDLHFWLGAGRHDLGSAGYLGVRFVNLARFSLGRSALPSALSPNSFSLGRSFTARFGFSRATFTRLGLTSLPFVGSHSLSGFDSHFSFVGCCGGIFGGFGPRLLRLGLVCRLKFGRSGLGAALWGVIAWHIRFASSDPSQIFGLGGVPRARRTFVICRVLVVVGGVVRAIRLAQGARDCVYGVFAALVTRWFFIVHVCDRGVFGSAQL
ncbi:hypothetical protein AB0383_48595 [Amycolatopsis sp. NPDC051373]|uniref:hypothetical protein n=1 Tax=Amycolatopsis sp. NPDC051373 TaxID=3155801 RepID=UPI00344BA321